MGHEKNPQNNPNAPHRSIVLIAGPTASGKSDLAIEVAKQCTGVVINVDSMQVYSELRIITARPSIAEEKLAPHELYGHVSARTPYSVGVWLDDAERVLDRCTAGGLTPIFVGGTGLYFKTLINGLANMPRIDRKIRERIRKSTENGESLHDRLSKCDPAMAARLYPSDIQRIKRALEVFESTGRSLSSWQQKRTRPLVNIANCCSIVLSPNRDWLQDRIRFRLKMMIKSGALNEAKSLIDMNLPVDAPALRAIGVKTMAAAANGTLELEAAEELCVIETRQYAKRQSTWFRNQFPDWQRIAPEDADRRAISQEIIQALQK